MTEERLALIERFCREAGGKSDRAYGENIVGMIRGIADEIRKQPTLLHEPTRLPPGPIQAYLEVVSPDWVLELVAALREERRLGVRSVPPT